MINFDDTKKQLSDMQKQFDKTKDIPVQIKKVSEAVKDSESKRLLQDLSGAFAEAMKDAQKGKLKDFTKFVNRAENLTNGNGS